jgi:hypothetical protein
MTENELLKRRVTPESIGMGSYGMDSHNVQRYVTPAGHVQNEGDIGVSTNGPYQISLGSIQPQRAQCENLLVPVCVSSSHIAFGSIRMEPVFMILGQSAATVAALAIDQDVAVQDVRYEQLRERLLADGQVLESHSAPRRVSVLPDSLPGVVVDDTAARITGVWASSQSVGKWVGAGYQHDAAAGDGASTATFEAILPHSGRYEVRMAFPAHTNRATNVPVTVWHADGEAKHEVNQRETPPHDGLFTTLGTYRFEAGQTARVVVRNENTNGHVTIDAVQWLSVTP